MNQEIERAVKDREKVIENIRNDIEQALSKDIEKSKTKVKRDFKKENMADVNLKISEDGISPGQACVFYKKDKLGYKVLGGGWIKN